MHRPTDPGRLQDRQTPLQAVAQQTPSEHTPDRQAVGWVQGSPSSPSSASGETSGTIV